MHPLPRNRLLSWSAVLHSTICHVCRNSLSVCVLVQLGALGTTATRIALFVDTHSHQTCCAIACSSLNIQAMHASDTFACEYAVQMESPCQTCSNCHLFREMATFRDDYHHVSSFFIDFSNPVVVDCTATVRERIWAIQSGTPKVFSYEDGFIRQLPTVYALTCMHVILNPSACARFFYASINFQAMFRGLHAIASGTAGGHIDAHGINASLAIALLRDLRQPVTSKLRQASALLLHRCQSVGKSQLYAHLFAALL